MEKRLEQRTAYDTSTSGKSTMLNTNTSTTLAMRQLQEIQERRMYLSQQQYIRETERIRNAGGRSHAHSRSVLANILTNGRQNRTQGPPQNVPSSFNNAMTSSQDSFCRTSLQQPAQGLTGSSYNVPCPSNAVTLSNQETLSNYQQPLNLRHELLMEVLSQFEKKIEAQQSKTVDYSKRILNANNGVAFDWGKLPRIGSVHSVQGIVGPPQSVQSPSVEPKESITELERSRMSNIEMSKLAKLILNGAFDYFLNQSSPSGNQTADNQRGVSGVQNLALDHRQDRGAQDLPVSQAPAKDDRPYLDDRQLEVIANQLISSFNQNTSQATSSTTWYSPSNTTPTTNFTGSRNYPQSNQRTNYNTSSNHSNVVRMTQGQASGMYGQTPIQTSTRTVPSVPWAPTNNNSSRYVRHPSISRPMTSSAQYVNGRYRAFYPHNGNVANSSVRTARVEPLSNAVNFRHTPPPPYVIPVLQSSTSTTSTTVHGQFVEKHDASSCLDCKLLGSCPTKKAIMAASLSEKEHDLNDSSSKDEEPELIITKVTTKDAERGPIERIDVDEWASSLEILPEAVKVKQEPVDEEDDVICLEEKLESDINTTVNQMRLMAENVLNDQNTVDTHSPTRSTQDLISDNITMDRQTVYEGTDADIDIDPHVTSNSVPFGDSDEAAVFEGTDGDIDTDPHVTSNSVPFGDSDEAAVFEGTDGDIDTDPHVTSNSVPFGDSDEAAVFEGTDGDIDTDPHVTSSPVSFGNIEEAAPETCDYSNDVSPSAGTGNDERTSPSCDNNPPTNRTDTSRIIPGDSGRYDLVVLTRKIDSLENYLTALKRRTSTSNRGTPNGEGKSWPDCTAAQNEYDKGDRNYEKYASMDPAENECSTIVDKRIESLGGSQATCESTCRRTGRTTGMSSQDVEAIGKLEKALEANKEKLKHQDVMWIRKNILKARLRMLKKIERIRQKYGPLPEKSTLNMSVIDIDFESRTIPANSQGKEVEDAAPKQTEEICTSLVNGVLDSDNPHELESDTGDKETSESTSEVTQLVEYPEDQTDRNEEKDLTEEKQDPIDEAGDNKTSKSTSVETQIVEYLCYIMQTDGSKVKDLNEEKQNPKDEAGDQETPDTIGEEILSNNDETSVDEVIGLGNEEEGNQDTDTISDETESIASDPENGLLENVVIKSEGTTHLKNMEGTISLEDAIRVLDESPQRQQDENQENDSSPSPSNDEEQLACKMSLTDELTSYESQDKTGESSDESLSPRNNVQLDQTVEGMRMRVSEPQPNPLSKSNNEIEDHQNKSSKKILESDTLNENNSNKTQGPSTVTINQYSTVPCSSPRKQLDDSLFTRDKNAIISNSTVDNPKQISVRKEKRKSDDQEKHVVKKKEKMDDREKTPKKKETSNNIWDILKSKYSYS